MHNSDSYQLRTHVDLKLQSGEQGRLDFYMSGLNNLVCSITLPIHSKSLKLLECMVIQTGSYLRNHSVKQIVKV